MDELAKRYLGYETISFEQLAGKVKIELFFDHQLILNRLPGIRCEDADVTMKLHQQLWDEYKKYQNY